MTAERTEHGYEGSLPALAGAEGSTAGGGFAGGSTTTGGPAGGRPVGRRAVVRFATYMLLMPTVLFTASGDIHWRMGWAYVLLIVVLTLAGRVLLMRRSADLLVERVRSIESREVPAWDRAILAVVVLFGPLALWVVAGLDERFGWPPPFRPGLQWIALGGILAGTALATWAMYANRFFSAVVRIQRERNQVVVAAGPYRLVRHPGYAGAILTNLAAPFTLGSAWALLPAAMIAAALVLRTVLEERVLRQGLEGYETYTNQVRYRLLPGIW